MFDRHAVPLLTLFATIGLSGGTFPVAQATCSVIPGQKYHGQLTKPLLMTTGYKYAELDSLVRTRDWLTDNGVKAAPRRGDCGPKCIYEQGSKKDRRDDEPRPRVIASNAPICDAQKISLDLATDAPYGVLIGRVTFESKTNAEGDASFAIGTGRGDRQSNPRRRADHYVVVTPSAQLIDKKTYAIWRIVALWERGPKSEYAVVDSGLFRVCLPKHVVTDVILASFRSCAEVDEFYMMSFNRIVQEAVFGGAQGDSSTAQRRLFSLLVLGDSATLVRLNSLPDSIRFAMPPGVQRDDESPEEARAHGPFAGATIGDPLIRRRLAVARYGELRVDAPLWYSCVDGCCAGEPW